jgi:hypothetical protein
MRKIAILIAVWSTGTMALPASAADDLGNGRRVQNTTAVHEVEVGDAAGHVVGVVEFKGLTFFASGAIATHVNSATYDLVDGSGPHAGYVVHYFDDGSTSVEKYQGRAMIEAAGDRTVVEGEFECVGGTGRFAGLKGEGHYRGERIGSLAAGSYVYIDFQGHCTTP